MGKGFGLLWYVIPLPNHRTVRHSAGQFVDGMASTNGIESFWSMLKRGYYGIYHRMSPKPSRAVRR